MIFAVCIKRQSGNRLRREPTRSTNTGGLVYNEPILRRRSNPPL